MATIEKSLEETAQKAETEGTCELVNAHVYNLSVYPVQASKEAHHAWLQMLRIIAQCADPKSPQIVCLRTAVSRCNHLLRVWKFPRMPLAINALLVQATWGKEDQTVAKFKFWNYDLFTQLFPAPPHLPPDVSIVHDMFSGHALGAVSPAQLISWYCKHYNLEGVWRSVVACLMEIPSLMTVAFSKGSAEISQIQLLLEQVPAMAMSRGRNGHLPLHQVFAFVHIADEGETPTVEAHSVTRLRPVFSSSERASLCKSLLDIYPAGVFLFTNVSSVHCGDDGFAPIHLECRLGPFASGDVIRQLSALWVGYFSRNTPSLLVQMRCQEPAPSFWTWLWKELTLLHLSDPSEGEVDNDMDLQGPEVLELLVKLECLSADAADALRESFEMFNSLPMSDLRLSVATLKVVTGDPVMESYLLFPALETFAASMHQQVRADPKVAQFFELDGHMQALVLHLAKVFRMYWRPHHVSQKAFQLDTVNIDTPLIQLEDYRKIAGNEGETVLEAILEAAEIPRYMYKTEAEQLTDQISPLEDELAKRAAKNSVNHRTPDFLFSTPVTVGGIGHPVRWIDAKSGWVVPLLTPLHQLARLVEQMLAYKLLFCSTQREPEYGLVFWRYSTVPQLLSIVPTGVCIATSGYCFEFGELNFAGNDVHIDDGDSPHSQMLPDMAALGATEGTWDISYLEVLPGIGYSREAKPAVLRELKKLINKRLHECFPHGISFAPYPHFG